jgi:hypothetical protein
MLSTRGSRRESPLRLTDAVMAAAGLAEDEGEVPLLAGVGAHVVALPVQPRLAAG